jgi:hypothetical protein
MIKLLMIPKRSIDVLQEKSDEAAIKNDIRRRAKYQVPAEGKPGAGRGRLRIEKGGASG